MPVRSLSVFIPSFFCMCSSCSHNNAKQTTPRSQRDYCGERRALRHLFLGPSETLQGLAPLYEAAWNGDATRLRALLFRTGHRNTANSSGGGGGVGGPLGAIRGDSIDNNNTVHGEESSSSSARRRRRKLSARGNVENNGLGGIKSSTNVVSGPIWDLALHLRVQFKFVEAGQDEAAPANVATVKMEEIEQESEMRCDKGKE